MRLPCRASKRSCCCSHDRTCSCASSVWCLPQMTASTLRSALPLPAWSFSIALQGSRRLRGALACLEELSWLLGVLFRVPQNISRYLNWTLQTPRHCILEGSAALHETTQFLCGNLPYAEALPITRRQFGHACFEGRGASTAGPQHVSSFQNPVTYERADKALRSWPGMMVICMPRSSGCHLSGLTALLRHHQIPWYLNTRFASTLIANLMVWGFLADATARQHPQSPQASQHYMCLWAGADE